MILEFFLSADRPTPVIENRGSKSHLNVNEKKKEKTHMCVNPLTDGAAYSRAFIFINTLSTTF